MIRSRFLLSTLLAASASLSLAVAGCAGGGDDDDDGASPTPECTPLPDANFSTIQTHVFNVSCALNSCHNSNGTESEGLALNAGVSYADTVGVPSQQQFNGTTTLMRVSTDGNPNASYLYLKVIGAAGIEGVRMPDTGQDLCEDKIDALAQWITDGALNN